MYVVSNLFAPCKLSISKPEMQCLFKDKDLKGDMSPGAREFAAQSGCAAAAAEPGCPAAAAQPGCSAAAQSGCSAAAAQPGCPAAAAEHIAVSAK